MYIRSLNIRTYVLKQILVFAFLIRATIHSADASVAVDGLYLGMSQALWHSIQQCWQPSVYVAALTHRFFKLTLQLIARYATWLNELVESKVRIEAIL